MAAQTIAAIKKDKDRVTITARVTELREPSEKQKTAGAHQCGNLTDETGVIRFISWARDDPPTLDEGTEYEITNARAEFYRGHAGIVIDSDTEVVPLGV